MSAPTSFALVTQGCKINQYESQSLREAWLATGAVEAADPDGADVLVFNSCAVTAKAVAELRSLVRKYARANPGARVVITGCAAQVLAESLRGTFPGAEIVPQADKPALLTRLPSSSPGIEVPEPPEPRPAFPAFSVRGAVRARAVAKVQDGCTQRCTYCIVPHTRGRAVSRPPDAALAEVAGLFEAGWREVVLSGVNLRQYGADLEPGLDFWDLVAALDAALAPRWAGRARLRLSSLDPSQLGAKALDVLSASRLVCPHLHLSLQSLAPSVLRRMGRGHYDPDRIAARVAELAGIWPVFGLGADILSGFPGETDDDFRETLARCADLPLSYAHVFPYSRRPGTPAASLPDQVPKETTKPRAAALRAMAGEKKRAFARRVAALPEVRVVLEDAETTHGVSEYYLDCRLTAPVPGAGPRDLVRVRPVGAARGVLRAEPVDNTGENA